MQDISGTEIQEITTSIKTFMDKLNDFSITVEAEFKNVSMFAFNSFNFFHI